MIDEATKKQIQVETHERAGSSVRVSLGMLDKVVKLFQENNISHWASHHAVSVDGSPMMVYIYLSLDSDPEPARVLLDRTP